MNIAVLTPERIQSIALLNNLVQHQLTPKLIIFEERKTRPKLIHQLKARLRPFLFFYREDVKIVRVKKRQEVKANKYLREAIKNLGLGSPLGTTIPTERVCSVNSTRVVELLVTFEIDLLFIWGIPILKPHIINAVRCMVVNAHTSLLPHYKGANVEFWMFHNNDFQHAGVTFHQVDAGVDTGAILDQIPASPSDFITPEWLRASNSIRVIKNLPLVLEKLIAKDTSLKIRKQDTDIQTRTYRFQDIQIEHLRKVYLA
ncbi:MAG: hypothetical protein LAT76_13320 [Schleiferiaceae bacterium]|nr:hypothetical protein [Schleiferiaceae bacterium]